MSTTELLADKIKPLKAAEAERHRILEAQAAQAEALYRREARLRGGLMRQRPFADSKTNLTEIYS